MDNNIYQYKKIIGMNAVGIDLPYFKRIQHYFCQFNLSQKRESFDEI